MTVLDLSRGACRGVSPGLFIAPDDESPAERDARETVALAVCARCPVRFLCLVDAEKSGYLRVSGGVAGGKVYRPDLRPVCVVCERPFTRPSPHGPTPFTCGDEPCVASLRNARQRAYRQRDPERWAAHKRGAWARRKAAAA